MSDDDQPQNEELNNYGDDARNTPHSPSQENVPLSPTEDLREICGNHENDDDQQNSEPFPRSPSIGETSPKAQQNVFNDNPKTPDIDNDDDVVQTEELNEDKQFPSAGPSDTNKRGLIDSDDSDNEGPSETPVKRRIALDDSDDEKEAVQQKETRQLFGDDSDDDDAPRKTGTGDEFNEFEEGNNLEDVPNNKQSDDDEVLDDDRKERDDNDHRFEWDFDIMLREKKAERKGKRRRGGKDTGIDIINDDDGVVTHLVERMKTAAKADRNANVERKPAFQKIKLLPEVRAMMLRAGIADALIENGFMGAVSEWLAPLPDKCLPALDIRITLLKLLHNPRYWKLDRSTLKHSGLGKAVMLLYKHPNETKENKMIANKLIGEWARPIFQLDTDYSSMTREERVVRDYERMPEVKKKKMNINKMNEDSDEERDKRRPQIKETDELGPTSSGQLKPGDKGYINRARVPKPSTRDYVVRPKWKVEGECKERKANGTRRYDQAFREFQERTKRSKASRAVTVSLEGRNLAI